MRIFGKKVFLVFVCFLVFLNSFVHATQREDASSSSLREKSSSSLREKSLSLRQTTPRLSSEELERKNAELEKKFKQKTPALPQNAPTLGTTRLSEDFEQIGVLESFLSEDEEAMRQKRFDSPIPSDDDRFSISSALSSDVRELDGDEADTKKNFARMILAEAKYFEIQKNYEGAGEKYRKAAMAGLIEAQYILGCKLLDSQKFKKKPAEAVRWFRRAAIRGHVEAQWRLGSCLEAGIGVAEPSPNHARYWFRRAANSGHKLAQISLQDVGPDVPEEEEQNKKVLPSPKVLSFPASFFSSANNEASGTKTRKSSEASEESEESAISALSNLSTENEEQLVEKIATDEDFRQKCMRNIEREKKRFSRFEQKSKFDEATRKKSDVRDMETFLLRGGFDPATGEKLENFSLPFQKPATPTKIRKVQPVVEPEVAEKEEIDTLDLTNATLAARRAAAQYRRALEHSSQRQSLLYGGEVKKEPEKFESRKPQLTHAEQEKKFLEDSEKIGETHEAALESKSQIEEMHKKVLEEKNAISILNSLLQYYKGMLPAVYILSLGVSVLASGLAIYSFFVPKKTAEKCMKHVDEGFFIIKKPDIGEKILKKIPEKINPGGSTLIFLVFLPLLLLFLLLKYRKKR